MRREPNYLLLGATVATLLAMFVGVLLFLSRTDIWGHRYQTVRIEFPHDMAMPNLAGGAQVTCAGITVGHVNDVSLEVAPRGSGEGETELCLVVDADVDTAIELRRDCKIRAEAPPLGGMGVLIIVHRGYSKERLAPGHTVAGLPPSGLNAVVSHLGDRVAAELDDKNPQGMLSMVKSQLDARSATSLMGKINGIAADLLVTSGRLKEQLDAQQQGSLLTQLDGTLADIKAMTGSLRAETNGQDSAALLGKLHTILSALSGASQSVAGMLHDNRPTIQATVSNVQDTTATIKNSLMPSLLLQMDPASQASLMSKFHLGADRTNASLGNLQELTASAKHLMVVNEESLAMTITNLEETSDHLRAASREIRRNPWRLLYQPKPGEVKQAAVADAARSFSDAAAKLDSTFSRVEAYAKASEANLPADDPQLKTLQQELSISLKNMSIAEKKFWELFAGKQ